MTDKTADFEEPCPDVVTAGDLVGLRRVRLCIGCGVALECVCLGDTIYPLCEECEQEERGRDEANRRLSVLADLERRSEDE